MANQVAGDLLAARSLWAVVGADGALVSGSGATAAVKTDTGPYNVTFNRDVAALRRLHDGAGVTLC